MTKKTLLSIAIYEATVAHRKQFDRAGLPYIFHCLKVMEYLGDTADEEVKCIAILHDIIEDTACTAKFLFEKGMTKRIVEGVLALTKYDGLSHEDYLDQIKLNKDAIKVKLADLRHNSDILRLKSVRQKDLDRTVKYHSMFLELKQLL